MEHASGKREVEQELVYFFDLVRHGKLQAANFALKHKFDDWESQIWSLWQDTYLIYSEEIDQEVEDDTFEGKAWLGDLSWLQDLAIEENFHWDADGQVVAAEGESVFVNVSYKGVVTDVSAIFLVEQREGKYYLVREIIHVG